MVKIDFSTKRLQINKANARIVIIISLAAVLTTFSLVASKALLSQRSYQTRVITEKKKAAEQLKKNREAVDSLKNSYAQFIAAPSNIIGGDPNGKGERDGDSAKIILDALPSKYDFPALTSSLEKLLIQRNFKFEGITGFDDELEQTKLSTSPNPTPIEIPFQLSATADFSSLGTLMRAMESSIRPFHIVAISLSGNDTETKIELTAKTYYQPAKSLDITTKEVK